MERTILTILVGDRKETATNVQKILTAWGCLIKTRLGLHDGTLDNCANSGLIILELVGDDEKKNELARKVSVLPGVSSKLINLKIED